MSAPAVEARGPTRAAHRTLLTRVLDRLRRHRGRKLELTLGLPVFFCVFYFALQRLPFPEARSFELNALDRWAGFAPAWVWIYQSVYVVMPIPPWLATSRRHLSLYARGLVLVSLTGFAVFAAFPVVCPRPEAVAEGGMFGLLVRYDGTRNAFPSLHCALALYTLLFARRALGGGLAPGVRLALAAAGGAWLLAVCHSTLATKQHYLVDVPAGLALAGAVHILVWSRERKHHWQNISP